MVAFEIVQHTLLHSATIWESLVHAFVVSGVAAGVAGLWGLRQQRELVRQIASELEDGKRAEDAMRESRAFFHAILEALPEHIAILDEAGYIIGVNGAWRRFGAANDLGIVDFGMGANYLEICQQAQGAGAADGRQVALGIQEVMTGRREEFHWEYPCHSPGEKRWFIVRVSRFDSPGPVHVVVAHENITARRLAEEAVREREENFRRLIANLPEVTWTSDASGRIHYISPNVQAVFGFTAEEVCERGDEIWLSRIHPADSARVAAAFQALLQSDQPYDVEYQIQRRDGGWIWIHDRAFKTYEKDGLCYADGTFSDVTERRRAQEVQAFLASIVKSSDNAIMGATLDGKIVSWNRGAEVLFGYEAAEVIGKSIALLATPEQAEEGFQVLEKVQRGETVPPLETARLRKDGTRVDVSLGVSPIRNAAGTVVGAAALAHDITEQKRAEESLRESEERYRVLFNSLSDAVFVVGIGAEGIPDRFVQVNDAACRRLGYTREELLRLGPKEIDSPETLRVMRANVERLMVQGQALFEIEQVARDGRRIPVELSIQLFELGGRRMALALARDITERKRADGALKESELRFRELAENIEEVFYIEGSQGLPMQYVSPAYERMWGRSCASVYAEPTSWLDAVHPEDQARVQALFQNMVQNGESLSCEFRIRRPDGEERWVWDRCFPVHDEAGKVNRFVGFAADITERKRAEEAVKESEERYRDLFENATDLIQIVTADLRLLYANRAWREAMGYDADELPRLSIVDTVHPDMRDHCVEIVRRLMAGEDVGRIEVTFVSKSGKEIAVEGSANCKFVDGKPVSTRGIFRDVTERKRAEEAAQSSERRYRSFVEGNAAAYLRTTPDGRILECNESFLRMLGFQSREELQLLRADDLYTDRAERRAMIRLLQEQKSLSNYEITLRRKDGVPVWALLNLTLVDAEEATIVEGTAIDITDRKQAQAALVASEQRYVDLFENAHDSIVLFDLSGRLAGVNRAGESLIGCPREEAGSLSVFQLLAPEYVESARQELARLGSGGEPTTREWEIITKDGRRVSVDVSARTIYQDGKPAGIQAIARDITDRKQAEQELKTAKEAAEIASRAKSEFLAVMSHEIRTPMNGIIGMTDLALDTELTSEQREYLSMVKESGDALLTLINDILDFSKIEAGKFALDRTEFDLDDCLAGIARTFAPRAHEKGLELSYYVLPEVPKALRGDPSRLRQIVVNLLGNALKFTECGGVTLRVALDSLDAQEACLHFTVNDTGPGIPEEKQRMIFDAFSQVDSSMTRKHGGTGLGLTISSKLARMMGGRLWVKSEPGAGSSFHFTARFGVQPVPTRLEPQATVNLAGMRVLVVDDNATNRRILEAMLRHWRMEPTLAEGGEPALARMEEQAAAGKTFPLVLLDAQMPEMDGFTLAEKIKQNPNLAGATIMMLTSIGHRGDAARCRELGIAAYLVKPIRQSELLEAILKALGKPGAASAHVPLVTRHYLREAHRAARILLAEDNVVNRKLIVTLLEKRGLTVTAAGNGKEALAALEKESFDLVLMDVQMPEMDGFEATSRIREKEKATGMHLPIIALTAYAMKGDEERCRAAGMDDYIPKPVRAPELFEAIHRQLPAAAGDSVRVSAISTVLTERR